MTDQSIDDTVDPLDQPTESDDLIASLEEKGNLGWRAASEVVKPFGRVPGNFTEAIRLLSHHYEQGSTELPLGAQNHLLRLLNNNTIKAAYYYVTKYYKPELLEGKERITTRDFLTMYSAMDHAALITFAYMFRNLSRKTEADEWDYVVAPLNEALALGGCVGSTIPEVGLSFGFLCRGLRYLAFATFLRENRRGFKEYRRHLKAKDLAFDKAFEEKTWRCNSIQVSAMIMERMGFNRRMVLQYVAAIEKDTKSPPDDLYGFRFRLAEAIIDSYTETGEIPDKAPGWVGKPFTMSNEVRGTVLQKFRTIIPRIGEYEWVSKGSSSVNPVSTPELFPRPSTDDSDSSLEA